MNIKWRCSNMTYPCFFRSSPLSQQTVDENRRRNRWWHYPVSAQNTALELYTVQKASPCGEADSAPAKCKCTLCYVPLQRKLATTTKPWMCFLTGIFRKFLPKYFEIREKYLLYNLLWSLKMCTSFPVCHSTLLSFLALTEMSWAHFL